MQVKILQEDLVKLLTTASRFVSTRTQLPVLSTILFSTDKNKITISATNLEMSFASSIGAEVKEEGSVAVPARVILETISNLGKNTIEMHLDKDNLVLKTQSFSAKIASANPVDFPAVPKELGDNTIPLTSKGLVQALSKVCFVASSDEARPVLTGVLFILAENTLTLVASDGFRLSKYQIKLTQEVESAKFIVPKNVLNEILRLGSETEGNINLEFRQSDNQVIFKVGEAYISSRIIDGNFPDFEKIIPKESKTQVLVSKTDFVKAVKLASVFARDAANVVKMEIGKDVLTIAADSQKTGTQKSEVKADVKGIALDEPQTVVFNYKFLQDFADIVVSDEIAIDIIDGNAPCVFKDTSDEKLLHLIMPVKLQG